MKNKTECVIMQVCKQNSQCFSYWKCLIKDTRYLLMCNCYLKLTDATEDNSINFILYTDARQLYDIMQ